MEVNEKAGVSFGEIKALSAKDRADFLKYVRFEKALVAGINFLLKETLPMNVAMSKEARGALELVVIESARYFYDRYTLVLLSAFPEGVSKKVEGLSKQARLLWARKYDEALNDYERSLRERILGKLN